MNIQNSFPEYSTSDQLVVEQKFFAHLCDLIVESIKAFTISRQELNKRFIHQNAEIFNKYFDNDQHVTLVGGHYGNWELFAVSAALNMPHNPIALFTPMSNKFMNDKIKKSRSKFGLQMKSYPQVKEILKLGLERQLSVIFAGDQCPHIQQQPYWTTFLNQETGVQYGTEKFARDNNTPVIYGLILKPKRGHYEIRYKVICEFPNELEHGAITDLHTRQLEEDIRNEPAFWLWTHKRWKRKKIDFDRFQESVAAQKKSA